MRNVLSVQLSSGENLMIPGQRPFPGFEVSEYASKFLPAKTVLSIEPVIRGTKKYHKETGLIPSFNLSMKLVGARLSEIELALECYDASGLEFAIHDLKNLFLDMSIPSVSRLAGQMEEMVNEKKFHEMKTMFWELKKIIGRIVKHRMQTAD